ncbi:flagellar hook-basal body protein [Virgibacillus soli]|uniref:flagellar hook-basal body protein n=1 Tax=Paracerasibacillus soli TaxID=480284 RepID=UPI0035E4DF00
MSRAMIQAAVSMGQLQHRMDVIGNNIANSQTTGYKSRQSQFSSLLFQQIDNMKNEQANGVGRLTPDGVRVGAGTRLGSIQTNYAKGSFVTTNRALDTALLGENYFFQVNVTENGVTETRYTRDGAFYLQPNENNDAVSLVTKNGDPVLGTNGPITIESGFDDITIRPNGEILAQRNGHGEVVGQLAIVETSKPHVLEAIGDNEFRIPNVVDENNSPIFQAAPGNSDLLQSQTLETSNVDMSKEMTDLLLTQRSYQFNARTISMGDQMLGMINQLR